MKKEKQANLAKVFQNTKTSQNSRPVPSSKSSKPRQPRNEGDNGATGTDNNNEPGPGSQVSQKDSATSTDCQKIIDKKVSEILKKSVTVKLFNMKKEEDGTMSITSKCPQCPTTIKITWDTLKWKTGNLYRHVKNCKGKEKNISSTSIFPKSLNDQKLLEENEDDVLPVNELVTTALIHGESSDILSKVTRVTPVHAPFKERQSDQDLDLIVSSHSETGEDSSEPVLPASLCETSLDVSDEEPVEPQLKRRKSKPLSDSDDDSGKHDEARADNFLAQDVSNKQKVLLTIESLRREPNGVEKSE